MTEIAPSPFDRAALNTAFERIGEMALSAGKLVDISVYGGSALVLTFNDRPATRDVDAVFERDRTFIRTATGAVAAEFGWPSDWLNDSVKGFLAMRMPSRAQRGCFAAIRLRAGSAFACW